MDDFTKMEISTDQLHPTPTTLKGFTEEVVQPKGSITLLVSIDMDPYITTMMTEFLVVRTWSAYNTHWFAHIECFKGNRLYSSFEDEVPSEDRSWRGAQLIGTCLGMLHLGAQATRKGSKGGRTTKDSRGGSPTTIGDIHD